MYKRVAQHGQIQYGVSRFTLDTPDDLTELKKLSAMQGSTAYVISTGDTYIVNSLGEWFKTVSGSNSGTSGGGDTVIDADPLTEEEILDIINSVKKQ